MKNTNLIIGAVAVGLVGLYLYNNNKQTSTTPQPNVAFANATGSLAGIRLPNGGVLTGRGGISPKQKCEQQYGHQWAEVSYPHPSGVGRMYIWECVDVVGSIGK
jgi:hypothetical protein